MMNKKVIMLMGMMFCGNSMIMTSQKTSVAQPLTAEENKKYQALVAEVQDTEWFETADKNNRIMSLSDAWKIAEKQVKFLEQQLKPSSFWPDWLVTLFGPFDLRKRYYLREIDKLRQVLEVLVLKRASF